MSFGTDFASKARQAAERAVIKAALIDLLKAGFIIRIDDGETEDEIQPKEQTPRGIMKDLFSVDEEFLHVYNDKICLGFIHLVHGNDGPDVISNYTVRLEPYLKKASEVSDKLEAGDFDIYFNKAKQDEI